MNKNEDFFTFSIKAFIGICGVIVTVTLLTGKVDVGIGFLGSILGGLIGGFFTLMGVSKTIDLQVSKEEIDRLPSKILNLDKVTTKYFNIMEDIMEMQNRIRNIRTIQALRKELEDFSKHLHSMSTELKTLSVHVNGEIFRRLNNIIPDNHMADLVIYINLHEGKENIADLLRTFNGSEELGEKEGYLKSRAYLVFRLEYEEVLEMLSLETFSFEWVQEKFISKLDEFRDRLDENQQVLFQYMEEYQKRLT
ncbi:hypothetical protein [Priestia megaterium]|uniref:hypothetical protein n=1 Tax=Priestia megaterium TaxID=1404 RepID=UPI002E1F8713|nr:hypothetical protein [Priestia megaterium]